MDSQETPKGMVFSSPHPGSISFSQGPMGTPVQFYKSKAPVQKFLKGEPKVLGAIQIMIALMNFSLGMVFILVSMNSHAVETFLFYTGYVFWGTAFFIISGSLSIAAENRTTNTLIQSSLAMNIVSSVVAGLGIIFFSFNLVMFAYSHYYYCRQEGYHDVCVFGHSLLLGSNGFLLILNVLEFAVSLGVSAFGCNA
uniref:Membrane spanning 4-domains A4A n=1 Tax=Vombatus ursinus TaxID=29139 RepID=A0A4X2L1Y8_VOMUR